MADDIKNIIQTPQQKLIDKVKKSPYAFNKENFKKFQDYFSAEFPNIDLEELRKQAWRIR